MKFEIEAPNGQILEIEGETMPSEAELDEIFHSTGSVAKQEEGNKGIDITPSGITKLPAKLVTQGVNKYIAAPVVSKMENMPYDKALQEVERRQSELEKPNPFQGAQDFIVDTVGYSALPIAKGAGGLNFAKNALIQGGIPGALEGLKEGNVLGGAGVGSAIASGVQAIPLIGKPVGNAIQKRLENPTFQNRLSKALEVLTSVPQKFSKRALEKELAGDSIFQGKFDAENAYRSIEAQLRKAKDMLPTSESYAQSFYDLGQRAKTGMEKIKEGAGNRIEEVLNKLSDKPVDIKGLKNSIQGMVNSAARGGDVNNILERAGGDVKDIYNKLGIKSEGQLQKELDNYYANSSFGNMNDAALSKEQENIAFDVLAQATGKDKRWLQSQLNANLPKMSTQKRQEFIQSLLENTADRVENIDPRWQNYFPELTPENMGGTSGTDIANNMFDKIMGKEFRSPNLNPEEMKIKELGSIYNNILADITRNPSEKAYSEALAKIDNIGFLSPEEKGILYEQFATDIDNIENIVNPKVKPIDLHNIKENLYDKANYDAPGGIRNNALKGFANQINNYLRRIEPQYQAPNDRFALIKNVENELGGINSSTIGGKLSKYGSKENLASGFDKKLKDIDTLLPNQYKFLKDTANLVDSRSKVENITKRIGEKYERNPKLLSNIKDVETEQALDELQKMTGVNFMEELNDIRAREALESFFPGQGGGSGSSQGFGNLLRTGIIGGASTTAAITHNPSALAGLGLVSPKLMARGTIKNLGALYRAAGREIPESIRRLLVPLVIKGTVPTLYGGISND